MLRWIALPALCVAFCAVGPAQEPGDVERNSTNVMKRLPGYVRLLPRAVVEPKGNAFRKDEPEAPAGKSGCAHILLAPIPENIDPGIELKVESKSSRMPKYRGLPPCPQDRR